MDAEPPGDAEAGELEIASDHVTPPTVPKSGGSGEATDVANTPHGGIPFDPDTLGMFWVLIVLGVPFVILILLKGWGATFRSGDAAAFICGVVVASIGENLLDQAQNNFSQVKSFIANRKAAPQRLVRNFIVINVAFLVWNAYFVVTDKYGRGLTVDWVQIVAFFGAVTFLPFLRFALTSLDLGSDSPDL